MKRCWQSVGAYAGGHLSVFIYLCISFPESSEPPAEFINAVSVFCPLWVNAATHSWKISLATNSNHLPDPSTGRTELRVTQSPARFGVWYGVQVKIAGKQQGEESKTQL